MTKKQLEDYQSKKAEIRELRYKLEHLGEGDSMIGHDTVMDYRTGFPRPQAVVGFDQAKYNHLKETYQKRLDKLEQECEEVALWVERIPKSLTRRIFRMHFIDGMSQEKVGKAVHLSQPEVSKKISQFLKLE